MIFIILGTLLVIIIGYISNYKKIYILDKQIKFVYNYLNKFKIYTELIDYIKHNNIKDSIKVSELSTQFNFTIPENEGLSLKEKLQKLKEYIIVNGEEIEEILGKYKEIDFKPRYSRQYYIASIIGFVKKEVNAPNSLDFNIYKTLWERITSWKGKKLREKKEIAQLKKIYLPINILKLLLAGYRTIIYIPLYLIWDVLLKDIFNANYRIKRDNIISKILGVIFTLVNIYSIINILITSNSL